MEMTIPVDPPITEKRLCLEVPEVAEPKHLTEHICHSDDKRDFIYGPDCERAVGLNIDNTINIATSDSSVNSNDGFDVYSSLSSLVSFALPFILSIRACIHLNSIAPLYGSASVGIRHAGAIILPTIMEFGTSVTSLVFESSPWKDMYLSLKDLNWEVFAGPALWIMLLLGTQYLKHFSNHDPPVLPRATRRAMTQHVNPLHRKSTKYQETF